MTIRSHINPRALSAQLEQQPQDSPAVVAIGELADSIIRSVRALGLSAPNCDQIREVESVIFGYVRDANPEAFIAPRVIPPQVEPRVIAHRNFRAPVFVRPSEAPGQWEAERIGRQAVNAAWLVAHPDIDGYMFDKEACDARMDPWITIVGCEQMRDGTVSLHYGRTGEKTVASDFEVYVSAKAVADADKAT